MSRGTAKGVLFIFRVYFGVYFADTLADVRGCALQGVADEEDFLDESVLQGSGGGGSGAMSLGGAPGETAARGAVSGRRTAAGGGASGSSASELGDTRDRLKNFDSKFCRKAFFIHGSLILISRIRIL